MRTEVWAARNSEPTSQPKVLYMSVELSLSKWKLAFTDGLKNPRVVTIAAADYSKMSEEIVKARKAFKLEAGCGVISCYEAGREGFSVHRALTANKIENLVVNSSSIKVSRRSRHAKTDRLDAEQLVRQLARHHANPTAKELQEVAVPTLAEEDRRQRVRELVELRKERTALKSRIRSLLFAHGLRPKMANEWDMDQLELSLVTTPIADAPELTARLKREFERLALVKDQIAAVDAARRAEIKAANDDAMRQIRVLMTLCGVGIESATTLVMELFWRKFPNRRALGSFLGLAPVAWASGQMSHEQGISKAGSPRLRALLIEVAWLWLLYQPESALSRWFNERFGKGGRARRVGIVALARRLAVALWRFHTHGEVPAGAQVREDRFASPPPKRTRKSAAAPLATQERETQAA